MRRSGMGTAMTLSEKQRLFHRLLTDLQVWGYAQGYEFTFGEAMRSDEQAEINYIGPSGRDAVAQLIERGFPKLAARLRNNGKTKSPSYTVHQDCLAVDLKLFINGIWQSDTEAYRPLGEKWESMHTLCRWGGRFNDGNHFSFEHNGVK